MPSREGARHRDYGGKAKSESLGGIEEIISIVEPVKRNCGHIAICAVLEMDYVVV
jgi:hypothetical protein